MTGTTTVLTFTDTFRNRAAFADTFRNCTFSLDGNSPVILRVLQTTLR